MMGVKVTGKSWLALASTMAVFTAVLAFTGRPTN